MNTPVVSQSPAEFETSFRRLRIVLWIDSIVLVVFSAVPCLIGSTFFAYLLGLELPAELIYVRLIGILALCWGVLVFLTIGRPMRNVDVVRMSIVLHMLVALTIVFGFFSSGVTGLFSLPNVAAPFWVFTLVVNVALGIVLGITLPQPHVADSAGRHESALDWKPRRQRPG